MLATDKNSFGRGLLTVLLLSVTLLASGCGLKLSDAGTETATSIDSSKYLDMTILDKEDEEILEKVYETHILEYGTFNTEVSGAASLFEPITYQEKVEAFSGTMIFNEFKVKQMDYVKEGDTIASISMETDSITIKEAELAYERLKTTYESAKKKYDDSIEDREETLKDIYTKEEKELCRLKWQITDLNWQKTEAAYKEQLTAAADNIKDLKTKAQTRTLKAQHTGYVYYLEDIISGAYLKSGQNLITIVPTNNVFVEMNDRDMICNFGKELKVSVRIGRNGKAEYTGYVINPPLKAMYFGLNSGKAQIEVGATMTATLSRASITISGVGATVENVLLVPYSAVEKTENNVFVTVMNEDGSLARLPFIAGGSNREYYWVISGLEAGMKVILK